MAKKNRILAIVCGWLYICCTKRSEGHTESEGIWLKLILRSFTPTTKQPTPAVKLLRRTNYFNQLSSKNGLLIFSLVYNIWCNRTYELGSLPLSSRCLFFFFFPTLTSSLFPFTLVRLSLSLSLLPFQCHSSFLLWSPTTRFPHYCQIGYAKWISNKLLACKLVLVVVVEKKNSQHQCLAQYTASGVNE